MRTRGQRNQRRYLALATLVLLTAPPFVGHAQSGAPPRPEGASAPVPVPSPAPTVTVPAPAAPPAALAPAAEPDAVPPGMVALDMENVDLPDVIRAMAKLLRKRIVFDDRVRGSVTVLSDEPVTLEQAYLMFESVLELKGFTLIEGPSGELKVIASSAARQAPLGLIGENSLPPGRDVFATRLIKLRHIKVDTILGTLQQLASKDASLIPDARTNSLIVTDTGASMRRMIGILAQIDVPTYQEQVHMIALEHADASEVTAQLREVFGSKGSGGSGAPAAAAIPVPPSIPRRGVLSEPTPPLPASANASAALASAEPRFIPDARTNSVLVLAPLALLDQVQRVVRLLDHERLGRGRIHIYRLENADAEEMAETLSSLAQGASAAPESGAGGGNAEGLAAAIAELEGGVRITADAATNSLIVQSSSSAYAAMVEVIRKLDVRRPQVMIEALMMEVRLNEGQALGTDLVYNTLLGDKRAPQTSGAIASTPGGSASSALGTSAGSALGSIPGAALNAAAKTPFTSTVIGKTVTFTDADGKVHSLPLISAVVAASRNNSDTNIISAPQILTADNEEAQIIIGETRGFPTTRLQAADPTGAASFQTSTQIERRDVGIKMRVTPQISQGDSVRMKIHTEVSNVTEPDNPFGPTTSNRQIENTVYVKDGESVMIGGIIQDQLQESDERVPLLGDLPLLGWLFRSSTQSSVKTNLLLLLTPHIVRDPIDLEALTLERRERFRDASPTLDDEDQDEERRRRALEAGIDLPRDTDPVRRELDAHSRRYPVERAPDLREERSILEEERRLNHLDAVPDQPVEPLPAPSGEFWVHVEAMGDAGEVMKLLEGLTAQGHTGSVEVRSENGIELRDLRFGPYASFAQARELADRIRSERGLSARVSGGPSSD